MNCPTDAKGEVVWLSNARQGGLPVFLGLKPGCLVFTSSAHRAVNPHARQGVSRRPCFIPPQTGAAVPDR